MLKKNIARTVYRFSLQRNVSWFLFAGTLFAGDGWRQAQPGYSFQFPRDHASHPEFKIEWWYYTGNLTSTGGERFGYQLTFFRVGIDPSPKNPSRWAVRDLFMTHFAITDVERGRFYYAERMNRAGLGWAGASSSEYRVWNQDWEAKLGAGKHQLRAAEETIGLALELAEGKSVVIHGDRGISQKGSQPGNASHYYSLTRMPTRGEIKVSGTRLGVMGDSWMDHEFGTSFLEPEQIGWDWFSIQLEDRAELMLFQLRREDGSPDSHSSGTWVEADGRYQAIGISEFQLQPGEIWKSQKTGADYPISWDITVPKKGLRLRVRALLAGQELITEKSTGVTYWEGAIEASGTRNGRRVRGRGYVEMTGYGGVPISEKLR
jgi:predicted secreted hydrolase